MMKKQIEKIEMGEFFKKISTHGFVYLDGEKRVCANVFWISVIVLGFISACFIVNDSFVAWRRNPVVTSVDAHFLSVLNVQFPTVTVCPVNFDDDRLGFIRAKLNEFEFRCNKSDEEFNGCEHSRDIRERLKFFLEPLKKTLIDIIEHYINEVSLINLDEESLKAKIGIITHLRSNYSLTDLESHLDGYLLGENSDLVAVLFAADEVQPQTLNDDDDEKVRRLALKTALVQYLGNSGNLGSLLANFADVVIGGSMNKTGNNAQDWSFDLNKSTFSKLERQFYNVIDALVLPQDWDEKIGISALDLSSILQEREEFYKGKSWQRSFPVSARKLNLTLHALPRNYLGRLISDNKEAAIKMMLLSTTLNPAVNTTSRFVARKLSHFRRHSKLRHFDERLDHFSAYFPVMDRNGIYPLSPFFAQLSKFNPQKLSGSIPLATDNGICSVFNSKGFDVVDAEKDVLLNSLESILRNGTEFKVESVKGFGYYYKIRLLLNKPWALKNSLNGLYRVSLNHWTGFFDNKFTGFDVRMGYETTLRVSPLIHNVSDDFRSLPKAMRQCRFSHELDPSKKSMFNFYSQRGCLFECALKAGKSLYNCTPWNYPGNYPDDGIPLCDGERAALFADRHFMSGSSCSESCAPDCETVSFRVQQSSHPIDDKCYKKEFNGYDDDEFDAFESGFNRMAKIDGAIFDWRIRRMMMRKTVTLPSKIDEEKHEHCGSSSSRLHFAVLNLVLESPYVGVVEKDVRVTWTEKFGMLGGTIGLFTGMSFISVVETVFWIFIFCKRTILTWFSKLKLFQ